MSRDQETSWWLCDATLPTRHWARLQVFADGTAEVFDLDGRYHRFPNHVEAEDWLAEDEYRPLEYLIANGDVEADLQSPSAASDQELRPKLLERSPSA